jgi:hypothetical protein
MYIKYSTSDIVDALLTPPGTQPSLIQSKRKQLKFPESIVEREKNGVEIVLQDVQSQ